MSTETQTVFDYILTTDQGRAVYGFRQHLENYLPIFPAEGCGGPALNYYPSQSTWMREQLEGTRLAFAIDWASRSGLWPVEMSGWDFLYAVDFTAICQALAARRRTSDLPTTEETGAWSRLIAEFMPAPVYPAPQPNAERDPIADNNY